MTLTYLDIIAVDIFIYQNSYQLYYSKYNVKILVPSECRTSKLDSIVQLPRVKQVKTGSELDSR